MNPEVSSVRDSDRIIGLLDYKTRKAEEGKTVLAFLQSAICNPQSVRHEHTRMRTHAVDIAMPYAPAGNAHDRTWTSKACPILGPQLCKAEAFLACLRRGLPAFDGVAASARSSSIAGTWH